MSVLLPRLVKPNMNSQILTAHTNSVHRMDLPVGARIQTDYQLYPPKGQNENYWGRFARMRQAFIDRYLRSEDNWVLWIDADIIDIPQTLFPHLEKRARDENALVSPLVSILGLHQNYDTAGTRPSFESRSSALPPPPGVYEMFALGGCVLVPAEVHRKVRFSAQSDDDSTANTEWTSLCVGAAEMGYQILWDTTITVEHANLPSYGEDWH